VLHGLLVLELETPIARLAIVTLLARGREPVDARRNIVVTSGIVRGVVRDGSTFQGGRKRRQQAEGCGTNAWWQELDCNQLAGSGSNEKSVQN
jgi:hypothetical protein